MKARLMGWLSKHQSTLRKKKPALGLPDRWLLFSSVIATLVGILMVYDSSSAIALRDFGNPYHFAKVQFQWLVLGYASLIVFSRFDYHRLSTVALPFLAVTLALLVAVFIPGIGIRALGANRWVNLGLFSLQPSELSKLALILYLATWLSREEKNRLGAFLLLMAMMGGLIVAQPDLGTAVIVAAIGFALYFLSGAPIVHLAIVVPVLVGGIVILAFTSAYRMQRIISYVNPNNDPLGSSYQIRQVLLALGSGGWLGVGIGQSRQKYEYLPEANTDSIFAIIGEEAGFIGASAIIVLFACVVWRGFRIAKRSHDRFGALLASGIATWIGVQSSINLAAMVALVPLTGVPLPFISYGGSSLVILLTAVGILLNISRHR